MPRTDSRHGAGGVTAQRPRSRTHYPDLSLKPGGSEEPFRLQAEAVRPRASENFTLRIVLEIDRVPHTITFPASPPGAVQLTSGASECRAVILDGQPLCDCAEFRYDSLCPHLLSLFAARILIEPETWGVQEGGNDGPH